jgi:endonuclease/exonuclease/phosphatase family metal-dependent hydrolase
VLCGDFNFDVSDPQHRMLNVSSRAGLKYRDAWAICHPGRPREPTYGVHDRIQWDRPDCLDFVFVTEDIAGRVGQMAVDVATAASDHQPVLIEIAA